MKYKNLTDLFFKRAAKYREKVFLRYKTRRHRPLESVTWSEASKQIEEIAHGLKSLGVEKGNNVCLLSATCHYWLLCDLGIITSGACTAPIYHSSTTETVKYIVNHSEAEIVFVRNKIQLQKLRANWSEMPKLKYAVVILDKGDLPENDPKIITLDELRAMGQEAMKKDPDFISLMAKEVGLEDTASIIYTSGTTGEPKGVVLTHRSLLTAALTFYQYAPMDEKFNLLSFLPLAHVFERVASQFYGIDQGVTFTYCEQPEMLPELLLESKCSVMMMVPRMLEKMQAKILLEANKLGKLQRKIFDSALETSLEYVKKKVAGEEIPGTLKFKHELAQRTVLSKVKKKIAPDLEFFVVGGAPLDEDLCLFFLALGFTIMEGYGLTETTAAITVNPPWAIRPGTVGLPFKHFELKISEEGEIMVKGPAVFEGYYKDPEKTAESFTEDGWFKTGDLGKLDDEGYLKITGRKKDILITAAGKNVAPERVENHIKRSEYISQVVILGDGEKYLAALICLDKEEIEEYIKEQDIPFEFGQSYEETPEIKKLIRAEISAKSTELASYEKIKAFHILDRELTIHDGELTPTLKIRRKEIRQKYRGIIQPLFNREKPKHHDMYQ